MHIILVKSDKKAREKPCLRCGYSLRKIIDSKFCPECGLSIWLSLSNNENLDWSNPSWLARLSVACFAMAVAQLLGLAAYVGLMWPRHISADWIDVLSGCGAAYAIISAAAMLVISSDEGRHPDRWRRYKWAIRIIAGLGILEGVAITMWLVRVPFGLRVEFHHFGLEVFVIASVLSTLAYLRTLAQRMPNATLAHLSGLLFLGSAVSTLAVLWLFASSGVLRFLPLGYLPLTCGLLEWFAVLFRKASVAAEKGWTSETAS